MWTGTSSDELKIVGSDNYWEVVIGRVIRGVSGSMAIETELGWVLSGLVVDASTEILGVITVYDNKEVLEGLASSPPWELSVAILNGLLRNQNPEQLHQYNVVICDQLR